MLIKFIPLTIKILYCMFESKNYKKIGMVASIIFVLVLGLSIAIGLLYPRSVDFDYTNININALNINYNRLGFTLPFSVMAVTNNHNYFDVTLHNINIFLYNPQYTGILGVGTSNDTTLKKRTTTTFPIQFMLNYHYTQDPNSILLGQISHCSQTLNFTASISSDYSCIVKKGSISITTAVSVPCNSIHT